MPIDDEILELLAEHDLIFSPSVVAKNIEKSRAEVNRRLSELAKRGLVNRVERGYYEIADAGRTYLEGGLDANGLED